MLKNKSLVFLFSIIVILLPSCSTYQNQNATLSNEWTSTLYHDHPLVGKIVDLNKDKLVSYQKLLQLSKSYRNILIGEKHDNPDHQRLEKQLIEDFTINHFKRDVIFEMITEDIKPKLSELNQVKSKDHLKQQLEWDNRGWKWENYGGVIYTGYQYGQNLKVGNLSSNTIKNIYSNGLNQNYASAIELKKDLLDKFLELLFESHCQAVPKEKLESMADIQLARDSFIAKQTIESENGAIVVAGSGHIRKDLGVPLHLSVMSNTAKNSSKTLSIAFIEVKPDKVDYKHYELGEKFDFVLFTPVFKEINYCEKFKQSLKK